MNDLSEFLQSTMESTAEKLHLLESEQSKIEDQIKQTKSEILRLEKTISSLRELQGQLSS